MGLRLLDNLLPFTFSTCALKKHHMICSCEYCSFAFGLTKRVYRVATLIPTRILKDTLARLSKKFALPTRVGFIVRTQSPWVLSTTHCVVAPHPSIVLPAKVGMHRVWTENAGKQHVEPVWVKSPIMAIQ